MQGEGVVDVPSEARLLRRAQRRSASSCLGCERQAGGIWDADASVTDVAGRTSSDARDCECRCHYLMKMLLALECEGKERRLANTMGKQSADRSAAAKRAGAALASAKQN